LSAARNRCLPPAFAVRQPRRVAAVLLQAISSSGSSAIAYPNRRSGLLGVGWKGSQYAQTRAKGGVRLDACPSAGLRWASSTGVRAHRCCRWGCQQVQSSCKECAQCECVATRIASHSSNVAALRIEVVLDQIGTSPGQRGRAIGGSQGFLTILKQKNRHMDRPRVSHSVICAEVKTNPKPGFTNSTWTTRWRFCQSAFGLTPLLATHLKDGWRPQIHYICFTSVLHQLGSSAMRN
jgi:hypothetical protein